MPRHRRRVILPPPLVLAAAAVLLLWYSYALGAHSWRLFGRRATEEEDDTGEELYTSEEIEGGVRTAQAMTAEQLQQMLDHYDGDAAVFFYTQWDAPSRHLLGIWDSIAHVLGGPSSSSFSCSSGGGSPDLLSKNGKLQIDHHHHHRHHHHQYESGSVPSSSLFSKRLCKNLPTLSFSSVANSPLRLFRRLLLRSHKQQQHYHQALKFFSFECQQSPEAAYICQNVGLPFLPSILFFSAAPLRSSTTCILDSTSAPTPTGAHFSAALKQDDRGITTATANRSTVVITNHEKVATEAQSPPKTAAAAAVAVAPTGSAGAQPHSTPTAVRKEATVEDSFYRRTETAEASSKSEEHPATQEDPATQKKFDAERNSIRAVQKRKEEIEHQKKQQEKEKRPWFYFFDEKEDAALPLRCARYKGDFFLQEALIDWLKMMRVISGLQQLFVQQERESASSTKGSTTEHAMLLPSTFLSEEETSDKKAAAAVIAQLQHQNSMLREELEKLRRQIDPLKNNTRRSI